MNDRLKATLQLIALLTGIAAALAAGVAACVFVVWVWQMVEAVALVFGAFAALVAGAM